MTILDRPHPDWKRPAIPTRVKLDVVIRQEGKCKATGEKLGTLSNTQFDHRPALWERKFDTEAWDTIPPANDPNYIEAVTIEAHDKRTNGPGGEKRITTAGSDAHRRKKDRRAAESRDEFRRNVIERECGQKRKPKGTIRSRGFAKRERTLIPN
ncbi:hypothetical protein [Pseudorhodoplanes sp.]|uniref:hypothetical protein n=1 Tax=Pseudorhodoplanes sp. TaxID=1934341 RepID=UPI002C034C55|nr:hypothetical protein [Pseudorhodoplanes sp.]HWV44072.1 hypothetical protein [Pseudorhodoplanes sp.]